MRATGNKALAGGDREEEAWGRAVVRKTSSQKWHLAGPQSLLSPAGNGVRAEAAAGKGSEVRLWAKHSVVG